MVVLEQRLIDLLQAKRREDPNGFREYLPGVDELLPDPPPRPSKTRPTFGLTERELSYHRTGLSEVLDKLDAGAITAEEAVRGLEHCAALLKGENMWYVWDNNLQYEMDHDVLKALVRTVLGKSPGSYKSKTTVSVGKGDVLEQVSVILGVFLDLDRNGRLVSISIDPYKYRKWPKLMKFVGGSRDESDVALRHDYYLSLQDPHGRD